MFLINIRTLLALAIILIVFVRNNSCLKKYTSKYKSKVEQLEDISDDDQIVNSIKYEKIKLIDNGNKTTNSVLPLTQEKKENEIISYKNNGLEKAGGGLGGGGGHGGGGHGGGGHGGVGHGGGGHGGGGHGGGGHGGGGHGGGGKRKKSKKQKPLIEKIMPYMVIPFMISTAMIPIMLMSLKMMLIKAMFIGKIAALMGILNLFRRRETGGGVYSHNAKEREVVKEHYGYTGDEEYGAYVNKKRRKRMLK